MSVFLEKSQGAEGARLDIFEYFIKINSIHILALVLRCRCFCLHENIQKHTKQSLSFRWPELKLCAA